MKELVFATNNPNKVAEVGEMLDGLFRIRSLVEIGCTEALPETHETLEENSLEKAEFVREKYGVDCFAEDTGLIVAALNGAPGVYSARYAGPGCSPADNIRKLLMEMRELAAGERRRAYFRTVFTLLIEGDMLQFSGEVHGHILEAPAGVDGFGYDPVFCPDGEHRSFAEMSREEKGRISHRGRALRKLLVHLRAEIGGLKL